MHELLEIFNKLDKQIIINYFEIKNNCIEFTFYSSFNSWSHSVKIIKENNEIFFKSYRLNAHEDILKYKFTSYAHNQIGVKIPIKEKDLILKTLTKYDRFKTK